MVCLAESLFLYKGKVKDIGEPYMLDGRLIYVASLFVYYL